MENKSSTKEKSLFTKMRGMEKIIEVYPKETQTSTAFIIEEIIKRTTFCKTKALELVEELEEKEFLAQYNKKKGEGPGPPSKYYYLTKPKKEILNKVRNNFKKKI